MLFQTINPATEALIQEYASLAVNQLPQVIESAHAAHQIWQKVSFEERAQCMRRLAQLLRDEKKELAILMATEMGKPIGLGQAEIEKCAWVCEHYAAYAQEYLQDKIIQTEMAKTVVCYRPLGVVFAIMPWNFPFWQVFRFAVPSLMAGNAALLKHAPICIASGNKIATLFQQAGFPAQLLQHVILDNPTAAKVLEHPHIAAVTLTGSERAGSEVGMNAGKNLKKMVLELGGNDPYIILADADLDLAAEQIVRSRLNNCGQVCIAAKRIIALEDIYSDLLTRIKKIIPAYQMGDPLQEETRLGPMARADLRETLHQQVLKSVKLGAHLLEGGYIPARSGFYYPPTILGEVTPGMPAFDEELFGPVLALIRASSEEEALHLANQSQYGLGAAVFTKNINHGEFLAKECVQAGSCFVNTLVSSDPRVPFGGIKRSGFGRELSQEGILEFVNIKTISIQHSL